MNKMLNKLQLNNLIISNKNKIHQSIVQTINKLVQKIRKFKTQLEKQPENEKHKERLRKATANIEYLKKLKRMDAVKCILLLDKNPAAIITNGRSTPEEVSIALLALNKIMKDLIQMFKLQLNLTESDCKWREELMEISKRRAKINRTEEKKKKRQDTKEQKVITRKRIEWIKENNPNAKEDAEPIISTVGNWKIESSSIQPSLFIEQATNSMQSKHLNKDKSSLNSNYEAINKSKTKFHESMPYKVNNAIQPENKKVKTKHETKSIKLTKNDDKVLGKAQKEPTIDAKPVVTHVVDSFFITESGENYMSTSVAIVDEKPQPSNEETTRVKVRENIRGTSNLPKRMNERNPMNMQKGTNSGRGTQTKSNDDKSMHPSWAAKQKLKPIISSFQGKKTTFDDD